MKRKLLSVLFMILFTTSFNKVKAQPSTDTSSHHCTMAYAMGNAVNGNRAILWRNCDWELPLHLTNMVYEGHNTDLQSWGPLKWLGLSQESWYIFGGLNEKGLGCFNTLLTDFATAGGYQVGNYAIQAWVLANCSTIVQVRNAIKEQLAYNNGTGGVDHHWGYNPGNYSPAMSLGVIDASGSTTLFEIAQKYYYEYDPTNAQRLSQFPVQIGVRANKPHSRTDFKDNTGTDYTTTGGRRYYEARDRLIGKAADADKLTLQEVMDTISRFGSPDFDGSYTDGISGCRNSNYLTQDAEIIWGAAPGDDPKTATLFYAPGKPDYSCYIPVWVANGNSLNIRLRDVANNPGSGTIVYQSNQLYEKRTDASYDQYINTFFTGMEANFREAVKIARTYWDANGFDAKMAGSITDEASETVYYTMLTMNKSTAHNLNPTPKLTALTPVVNGSIVSLSATASDDGTIASTSWNFGDGQTGSGNPVTHTYSIPGTYLVRCTVTDDKGSRNSKWIFVNTLATGIQDLANNAFVTIYPNPSTGHFTIDLSQLHFLGNGARQISIYNLTASQIQTNLYAATAKYDLDLSDLPAGIYFVKIEDKQGLTVYKKIILTNDQ